MIIDFILAALAGIFTQNFSIFLILLVLAVLYAALLGRPDRPFSSGLVRLALIALGISVLFSLFGGGGDGGDCDCDFDL